MTTNVTSKSIVSFLNKKYDVLAFMCQNRDSAKESFTISVSTEELAKKLCMSEASANYYLQELLEESLIEKLDNNKYLVSLHALDIYRYLKL